MASVALPLTDRISQAAIVAVSYNIKQAQFGNGYSQRAKDGINNKQQTWTLVYSGLNNTEFNTLMDALDSTNGADVITWTPYNETGSPQDEKKFILDGDVSVAFVSGNLQDVQVILKEVFDAA